MNPFSIKIIIVYIAAIIPGLALFSIGKKRQGMIFIALTVVSFLGFLLFMKSESIGKVFFISAILLWVLQLIYLISLFIMTKLQSKRTETLHQSTVSEPLDSSHPETNLWKDLVDTIKDIREWINSHHKTTIITIFVFVTCTPSQSKLGDPGFIILILFFGLPTALGFCRGIGSIFSREFLFYSAKIKVRILLLTIPLLILSLGIVVFLMAFLGEFFSQLTCSGAGCAQGGLGLFMVLPYAWVSFLLIKFTNHCFIYYSIWPSPLKPDFSYEGLQWNK